MPVALFEFLLFVVVLVFASTQLLWPVWRGTPLLPFFRRERVLQWKIEEQRQQQVERELERYLQQLETTDAHAPRQVRRRHPRHPAD